MRTAPIGPSNGMPEIISEAEAALIDRTSNGLCWSAPRTVVTIWVSLRKPSGNDGRSGRSVRRQVRMASSLGRPSRRKNEPGILPAAYDRSSTSTVNGKKSMPSRTLLAALAVVRTFVPPIDATTAPIDWGASLPVSKVSVFSVPETGPDTTMGSATEGSFQCTAARRAAACVLWSEGAGSQLATPNFDPVRTGEFGISNRQPTAVRSCHEIGPSDLGQQHTVTKAKAPRPGQGATEERPRHERGPKAADPSEFRRDHGRSSARRAATPLPLGNEEPAERSRSDELARR